MILFVFLCFLESSKISVFEGVGGISCYSTNPIYLLMQLKYKCEFVEDHPDRPDRLVLVDLAV